MIPDASEAVSEPDFDLSALERRAGRLEGQAQALHAEHARLRAELGAARAFLELAPQAQARLEELSRDLFGELMEEVEANLTHAVREILGQERKVVSRREIKNGRFHINLEIENQGRPEDILHGQGGSVCNILSVGLRLIGLAQLDPAHHRRFLVLDEQDCWLRPELVPAFTRLFARIGEKLGLQVLSISHHPVERFSDHAGRVFQLSPGGEAGVKVRLLSEAAPAGRGEQEAGAGPEGAEDEAEV
ncbi:hypothetical protein NNJEOMEG_00940 [Fundidesulfovibrio magnetotacticus]|uniref:Uncharacterized protein n=1 Tax=Fundidesulfovibrio magnetotacticus TaxID=2730080 RepID=A0A6V8LRD3_9BACT|nr:hypothetical protein [Fundidesulfovibrio magnetotacticus]GFK93111.1 hypothetical protein NNJEOMEG_00940 [Fundidesulfovibrio magnetotacticus]